MLAINVFAADTDAEGARLRTSMQQAFLNLRRGTPGYLPPPVDDIREVASAAELSMVEQALSVSAVGAKESVAAKLESLIARHAPDEVILTGQIHDHEARLKSFAIAAEVLAG